jgi:NADH:ubiquinone oxidoreductase subunit 6 (subunit J)
MQEEIKFLKIPHYKNNTKEKKISCKYHCNINRNDYHLIFIHIIFQYLYAFDIIHCVVLLYLVKVIYLHMHRYDNMISL